MENPFLVIRACCFRTKIVQAGRKSKPLREFGRVFRAEPSRAEPGRDAGTERDAGTQPGPGAGGARWSSTETRKKIPADFGRNAVSPLDGEILLFCAGMRGFP